MSTSSKVEPVVEAVLFSSDTLSKIISCLPSVDVLNLAVTCKRLGSASNDKPPLIEESVRIAIHDIATEEELETLPYYTNGENSLTNYHYVNNGDKSYVRHSGRREVYVETAYSNNILRRAGKHYVSFTIGSKINKHLCLWLGVMRPGKANGFTDWSLPIYNTFFQHISRMESHGDHDNGSGSGSVDCCMYCAYSGRCYSGEWSHTRAYNIDIWERSESMSLGDEVGMLLDLDEGTLSVYKNGRKLGAIKSGLAGHYCWVVSMTKHVRVSMKRGVMPHQVEI